MADTGIPTLAEILQGKDQAKAEELKAREAQAWGGLKSYLPEQPEAMRSAQSTIGRGISAVPPEVMLMLNFLGRSQVGAAIGRDNVMARTLERRAPQSEARHPVTGELLMRYPTDPGITMGNPGRAENSGAVSRLPGRVTLPTLRDE